MGNDDERFTDNCGWPGNERVTVSMIFFHFSLQLSLALMGVFYILTLLNVACFQHNKDIFFFKILNKQSHLAILQSLFCFNYVLCICLK